MKRFLLLALVFCWLYPVNAQSLEWARNMGGSSYDYGVSVAVDAAGNVYTTGNFDGTSDFDPGPGVFNLTSTANGSMFVSKLDASGNFVWARLISSTWRVTGDDIALDTAGNIYLTGSFSSTTDFDPGPGVVNLVSAGQSDVFVLKLNASGNFVWARKMGGTSNEYAWSLALDASGNVYAIGQFQATADFDPGTPVFNLVSAGQDDIFICKLNASGNFVWARRLGGTSQDYGTSIAIDGAGNVCATGVFQGTADFDPGTGTYNLTTAGVTDIFICKLDAAGNFIWAKRMGGLSLDEPYSIAVDQSGHILTTGFFQATADFDPGTGVYNLTSAGGDNVFVSKVDSSGNFVWAKQLGGSGYADAYSIAVDESGNAYIFGIFSGTADFDPGPGVFPFTSLGQQDLFLTKLNSSGNFVWALHMGGTLNEAGNAVALGPSGGVYTTGYFQGTVNFDPGPGVFNLTSIGGYDVFIQKIAQCTNTSSTIAPTACFGYTSPGGTHFWTTSGTYTDTIPNTDGCDSVITINLTIHTVDTAVSPNPPVFSSNATGAAYQWLDCSNGYAAIAGATNQSFTATANGSYAVEVTQNGCTDTSACYNINNIGIREQDGLLKFALYPNPTRGMIHLQSGGENLHVEIFNMLGEKVRTFQTEDASVTIDLTNCPQGVYVVRIREARSGMATQTKVLKW